LRDNVSSKKDTDQKTNDVLGEKYGVKLEKYITETKYKAFENNGEFETGYNCGYNGGFLNCSASAELHLQCCIIRMSFCSKKTSTTTLDTNVE
jgi:hypothetical protein